MSLFYLKMPCSQCYVLSDAYCRTKKYLLGLALGLPCVSYGWIKECIAKVYTCRETVANGHTVRYMYM